MDEKLLLRKSRCVRLRLVSAGRGPVSCIMQNALNFSISCSCCDDQKIFQAHPSNAVRNKWLQQTQHDEAKCKKTSRPLKGQKRHLLLSSLGFRHQDASKSKHDYLHILPLEKKMLLQWSMSWKFEPKSNAPGSGSTILQVWVHR